MSFREDALKRRLEKEQNKSTAFQLAGTLVGGVAGAAVGNPLLGASIGGTAGSALGTLASSADRGDKAKALAGNGLSIGTSLAGGSALARKQEALNIDMSKSTIDNAIKAVDELPPDQQVKYKPMLLQAQERAYGWRIS